MRALRTSLSSGIVAVAALAFAGAALAQANLDIDTPAIRSLTGSMQQRYAQLQPYYASGAVGFTRDGLIALHNAAAVPLPQRAQANALVAGENQDRLALYREAADQLVARDLAYPAFETPEELEALRQSAKNETKSRARTPIPSGRRTSAPSSASAGSRRRRAAGGCRTPAATGAESKRFAGSCGQFHLVAASRPCVRRERARARWRT